MATNITQLTPAFAIHPGEILKDELMAREITQKEFAALTGIPQTQLNEIIKGKRGIYADTALLIAKALKMDAIVWTNLQTNYELDLAKLNAKNKARLEAIHIWQMMDDFIPVKFFKREKIISGNPIADIPVINSIYNIAHAEQLATLYSQPVYARFRKSDKLTVEKINVVGWTKLVAFKATQQNVSAFNHREEAALLTELNKLFEKNKNTVASTTACLVAYGIKLVIQKHPEKCAVDGVSFWSNGNPAIGLPMRFNRIDNFAFTLMHELGHVFLHLLNNNTAQFIDVEEDTDGYKNSKEEKEADDFARDALINKAEWNNFFNQTPVFDEAAILKFARKQKLHPAIVKGRFMFETKDFKVRSNIKTAIE